MERLEDVDPETIPTKTKVFINGDWVGMHKNGSFMTSSIKSVRRQGKMPEEVSIVRDI